MRDHVSAVGDFYNGEEVRERYYPEIERLVCEETGATRAFMFDHTIRSVAWSDRGVRDTPLAICDAGSMLPGDFVATEMRYRDRTGETYSIGYNPNHRWYYVPDMRRDEVLIFKCFDSADDGRARYGAHSAFDDPTSMSATPERESIEARLLVFF